MLSTNGEPSVSGGVNDMSTSDVRMGRDERDKGYSLSLSRKKFFPSRRVTDHENNNASML